MELSLIIPAYNNAATVGAQLDALVGQDWPGGWEVILADNGSTDDTVSIFKNYRHKLPRLQVVDAGAKQGAAFARNMGAMAASGEAILFIDADDVVAPNWLSAIGDALKCRDFVASRFDIEYLNQDEYQGYNSGTQTRGLQKLWYPPYCVHSGGCGLGIKRAFHTAVGGFDETMNQLEDTDYCIRVQQQGTPLHFVPDAVVYVRNRTTLYGIYCQSRGFSEYNVWLSKKYKSYGQPIRHPWRQYFGDWKNLLKQVRKVHRKSGQAQIVWGLGQQLGRFYGVLKYRVPPV